VDNLPFASQANALAVLTFFLLFLFYFFFFFPFFPWCAGEKGSSSISWVTSDAGSRGAAALSNDSLLLMPLPLPPPLFLFITDMCSWYIGIRSHLSFHTYEMKETAGQR
jgi:hypothetical protein